MTLQSDDQSSVEEGETRRWLVRPQRVVDPSVRLFLLPHAGGSASTFRAWNGEFPSYVELCAVQLPGREGRFKEPPIRSMRELVSAVSEAIVPLLDRPFVLFGHSMGAIVAFELVRHLIATSSPAPLDLIVSGHAAPGAFCHRARPLHRLPDKELIETIRQFGGTLQVVLDDRELMEIQVPVIRADFEAYETWMPKVDPAIECPILAVSGEGDASVSTEALEAWQEVTTGRCDCRHLPGAHFYTKAGQALLFRLIAARLASALGREPDSGGGFTSVP